MAPPPDSIPLGERAPPEPGSAPGELLAAAARAEACTIRATDAGLEIELHGSADVASAEALYAELAAAAAPGQHVSIDLGGIDRLDAAALQLLLAFKVYLEHGGGSLQVVAAAAPIVAALANMGAEETLGLVRVRGAASS